MLTELYNQNSSSHWKFEYAWVFVERCQNFDPQHPDDADGGFFFSTTEFDTNKSEVTGRRRSTASWRCWRLAVKRAIRLSPPPGDGC